MKNTSTRLIQERNLTARTALNRRFESVTRLKAHERAVVTMTRTGAQEALAGNDDRYGFIRRLHFVRRLFGLFNHRTARIGKTLG